MLADAQDLLDAIDGVAYLVGLDGRIVAYGRPGWDRFARANGAPELLDPARVLSLDLAGVVQGEEVRDVYARVMRELHSGEADSVTFPFRCDAPRLRRELRMAVTQVRRDGSPVGYLYASTTLSEDERPPLDLYDFQAMAQAWAEYRSRPLIAMCSFCLRVRPASNDSDWIEADEYYRAGGASVVSVSHGVCARCAARIDGALVA